MARKSKAAVAAAAPAAGTPPPVPPVSGAEVPAGTPPVTAPPVEPKVVKEKQPSANGVTRPTPGTTTAKVWDIADGISTTNNKPATRKEVVEQAAAQGINVSTATTQFGKWARFFGYIGEKAPGRPEAAPVVPAVAGAVPPVVPAPPAAPAATPIAPTPEQDKTQEGRDGFAAASAGQTVTNPYIAGSPENDTFVAGWTEAATAAQVAAAAAPAQ